MKKIRKTIFALMLSVMTVLGVMPAGNPVAVHAAISKKQTAKFVKAVDGDTAKLKVKGKTYTFRFLAVDTPETVKPGQDVAYCGKKASDYTKKTLKKAKKIQIQYDGAKTDKYGRRLAWVWVDGKLLQDNLVKKGYARVYYIYNKYKYTSKLYESQKVAKRKKLGIWKNYSAAFPEEKNNTSDNTSNNNSSSNNTSNNNTSNNTSNKPVTGYVWISRTGKKYHKTSSCSNMKTPSKVSLSDAKNKGLTACEKCY